MSIRPQVAIYKDFLDAYSKIPKIQQKRVREFVNKFMIDPTLRSIHYEKIHDVKDNKIRTVRINDSYRAIILHPQEGNIYLLVWVDHHDEAMRWAKNKVFKINKHTGALQIIDYKLIEISQEIQKNDMEELLLKDYDDDSLLVLGVPKILLPAIRGIKKEEDLKEISKYLPEEAYEGIGYLLLGYSIEQTMNKLCRKKSLKVNENSYNKALQNPDTKRRFKVITNAIELLDILEQPFEKWKVFLHPSQLEIVIGKNGYYEGAIKIIGGAGTGKTVVALHRAKYLAENILKKNEKLLFTTSTKTLANKILYQIKQICSKEVMQKIEVIDFFSFITSYMKSQGHKFNIIDKETEQIFWENVTKNTNMNMNKQFYKDEWNKVILYNNINDKESYLKISREGRRFRLSKKQREKVWTILSLYRKKLEKHQLSEKVDLIRKAITHFDSKSNYLPYKSIIIDEAQDFNQEEFLLIRKLIPKGKNDIFIVADPNQRINESNVVLSRCGINIRGKRSKQLSINYRTSEEINTFANKLIKDILIDDLDDKKIETIPSISLIHGDPPKIYQFNTFFEEVDFISKTLKEMIKNNIDYNNICITTRTNNMLKTIYQPALQYYNIPYETIEQDMKEKMGKQVKIKRINVSTMYNVKGLEFQVIFIVGANNDVILKKLNQCNDNISKQYTVLKEKRLLYMASTRARDHLIITCFGEKSMLLQS